MPRRFWQKLLGKGRSLSVTERKATNEKQPTTSCPGRSTTSCVTCNEIFVRADIALRELPKPTKEVRYFDHTGLRISAESGCHWCANLIHHYKIAYSKIGDPEYPFEATKWGAHLQWQNHLRGPDEKMSDRWELVSYEPFLRVGSQQVPTFHVWLGPATDHSLVAASPGNFPTSTSSNECIDLVMRWVRDCQENHPMCKSRSDRWLPSRLVDVRDIPKLIETHPFLEEDLAPYIALSHRWGTNPTDVFKLEYTNKALLMHALPLDELPPVFRDAIEFTQRSGFRYLWIDSICILQDSDDDWKTEAAQMSKVYASCALNIAADLPGSSHSGLFYSRSSASRDYLAAYRTRVERREVVKDYYFTSQRNVQLSIDGTRELRSRAWVMQEFVLSPRTLTFSDQLFWDCFEESKTETERDGRGWTQSYFRRIGLKDWKQRLEQGEQNFEQWYWLLGHYLLCQMTFRSDILVAIGAVAEEFAVRMETTYCAGLWREEMPSCLIWASQPISSPSVFATRQDTYRAPTWSWASLDFDIDSTRMHATSKSGYGIVLLVEVLDIKMISPRGNIYTDITSMELILRGRIEPIELPSLGTQLMAEEGYHETRRGGYMLDLGPGSTEGATVYLLPICHGIQFGTDDDNYVQALLLKPSTSREGTVQTFERIGMATIVEYMQPDDLDWVFEFRYLGVGHMSRQIILV